jgi:hypothetical protein
MTRETIETVWPAENFAQFGVRVQERLFQTREDMSKLRDRRYRVRVTIETLEPPPKPHTREGDERATVAHAAGGDVE